MRSVVLFCVILVASLCPIQSATISIDALNYRITDADRQEVELTYQLGNDTLNYAQFSHVEIPSTINYDGKDYKVVAIGDSAFRLAWSVKTVSIPTTVTAIGKQAFYDSGIVDITLPNSVTTIGEYAFTYCVYLEHCKISDNVQELKRGTFSATYSLTEVSLSTSVIKTIGSGAFYESAISQIELPEGLVTIEDGAFAETLLRSIVIPDKVTYIGYGAFDYVPLDTVIFGASVEVIDAFAFSECYYLSYMNEFPHTLKYIGFGAFQVADFENLHLTIPGSVICIGEYAFGSTNLAALNLEQGVDSIMEGAFEGNNLQQVEIPSSATYIGYGAFANNPQLTSILVDTENGHYASSDGIMYNKKKDTLLFCPGGKAGELVVPDGVLTISDLAFQSCAKLTTVTLPEGLISVGDAAFYECAQLDSVYVPQSIQSWGANTMSYTKWSNNHGRGLQYLGPVALNNNWGGDAEFVFREGTTCIAAQSFCMNENLRHIQLPKGVKYICHNAFCNNDNLTTVRLPETIERIDYGAFQSNRRLKNINIPASVDSVGSQCFYLSGGFQGTKWRMFCYRQTPPPHRGWGWCVQNDWQSTCTLYVPQGCVEVYKAHCGASFADIREPGPLGDLNGDFLLDIADVNAVINMMLGKVEGDVFLSDLNGDQVIDIVEVNTIINKMLGKD
jgi:hypothetical protein